VSEEFELLVLGGGPAGLAGARGYRAAGGRGAVAIVTDEHRMPYNRPPLTKELLAGELDEAALPIEEEGWLERQRVRLIGGRAVALDAERQTVTLSGGRTLAYATCLLATGAEPRRLPLPGADDPAVGVIRSVDHVRDLLRRVTPQDAVIVIGSGFIGCEIAASLRRRGHAEVTLISDETAPNAARLGDEAARRLLVWLQEAGVTVAMGTGVQDIARRDGRVEVVAGETRVSATAVVMATGVAPRGELAQLAGIELSDDGTIPVGADMRSTVPGLLAAGDVCLAANTAAGRPLRVEHWGDALGQGDVAGRTAAGAEAAWSAVPGFWSTIGTHTLKYAAWGDGFDDVRLDDRGGGAFTAWYGRDGHVVGVLTHEIDADYERGRALIAEGAPWR
jgi:NADPH-dependent 2,4-dienoyl-CoA reductase/sulfur reductase-like enzyme